MVLDLSDDEATALAQLLQYRRIEPALECGNARRLECCGSVFVNGTAFSPAF